jgi:putative selenium metabolism protein SsnA
MHTPSLIVGPATIVTNDPAQPVIQNSAVLCENGRVSTIGAFDTLRKQSASATVLPADGKVIFPGLINAHHHLYSTFSRGMPIPAGTHLTNFTEILEGIWWRLDRAIDLTDVEVGAWPPLVECLRWGCTTFIDHHASPDAILGSLDVLAKVADELSLRGAFCYELTDRNGPEGTKLGIEENSRFAKACSAGSRHRPLLGLHASFTVSDETLAAAAKAWPSDVPIHIHVAEDQSDVIRTKDQYGRSIVERLDANGLLRKGSILVHGIHLNEQDLKRIAEAGAWLVHNPESNANNAVGHLDVLKAMDLGVNVALGTDGMASNMLRAAKSAYLMIRHQRRTPTVGFDLPRKLLLEQNAKLAQQLFGDPTIGTLKVGAPADLCVLDYLSPTPLDASTFDGHLVFGLTEAPVLATVSNGRIRFDRGSFPGIDFRTLDQRLMQSAKRVWERLGKI